MFAYTTKALVAASVLAMAAPALAQSGGTRGGVEGRDVSARTSGYGSSDGSGINTGGTANAEARRGGETGTNVQSRVNDRRGVTRANAYARDEDERARSRTRTVTRQGQEVRSRTVSRYKERGQAPVREVVSTGSPRRNGGGGRDD